MQTLPSLCYYSFFLHVQYLYCDQKVTSNYLITESEVVAGKSRTEALPYWPCDSEVNAVGWGLRFSCNDWTVEVIKLFIIWLINKEKKSFEWKSSIYIRRCARLPIHSSSQTQGRTTQSVNFTTVLRIPLKTLICLREKWLSQPQKGILVSWYHKLMGEFFQLMWRNINAYRKDRKCFKIVQTNGLSVKENTSASECTAQNKLTSITTFTFDNISSPSSFWDLWMNFSSLVNICSCQKHCYWQKPPDCLHLMILEADLHLLVLKRGNLFDENFDRVQYFGNCCD